MLAGPFVSSGFLSSLGVAGKANAQLCSAGASAVGSAGGSVGSSGVLLLVFCFFLQYLPCKLLASFVAWS